MIDSISRKTGIRYKTLWLGGVFNYTAKSIYNINLVSYYVVPFNGYLNNKDLPDTINYRWFKFQNAIKEISSPSCSLIVQQIMKRPKIVWTATFDENGYSIPFDKNKIRFKVIKAFSKLED